MLFQKLVKGRWVISLHAMLILAFITSCYPGQSDAESENRIMEDSSPDSYSSLHSENSIEGSIQDPSKEVEAEQRDYQIEIGNANFEIIRFNDDSIIAVNAVEYYPETDSVNNLDDVNANQSVVEKFSNPLLNSDIELFSNTDAGYNYKDITLIFDTLGFELIDSDLESINNSEEYYLTSKISRDNLTIAVSSSKSGYHKVSMIEINNSEGSYISTIPIESSKSQIISLFGQPNFRTNDDQIFLYHDFRSLRQLAIFWDEEKIRKIQYIAWDGV